MLQVTKKEINISKELKEKTVDYENKENIEITKLENGQFICSSLYN